MDRYRPVPFWVAMEGIPERVLPPCPSTRSARIADGRPAEIAMPKITTYDFPEPSPAQTTSFSSKFFVFTASRLNSARFRFSIEHLHGYYPHLWCEKNRGYLNLSARADPKLG